MMCLIVFDGAELTGIHVFRAQTVNLIQGDLKVVSKRLN